MIPIKHITSLALIINLLMGIPAFSQTEKKPDEIILAVVEDGIEILQDPTLAGAKNLIERQARIWQLLEPHFNLEEMSKRALGHHWRQRTPEERKEFITAFTSTLKRVYLGKTDTYRGERVDYIRTMMKGNRSKVQTYVYTANGDKFSIDFSLINNTNTWKIYDVTIEGVSIIGNYRSQFNSILNRSSFEKLMTDLRKKG